MSHSDMVAETYLSLLSEKDLYSISVYEFHFSVMDTGMIFLSGT